MTKNRLEGFSDGVFSIIITIMVLDLKQPETGSWQALLQPELLHTVLAYGLSFILVGSFWISHHQIMGNINQVDRQLLWHNLRAIFSITFVPFVTQWRSDFSHSQAAGVVYGLVYLWSLISLYQLSHAVATRTTSKQATQMRAYNHTRWHMILVAILGTGASFIVPSASSWSVLIIWVVWTWLAKQKVSH
ncbi:DUF1211 domain-containing protein [Weissella diestrammenae]|uniref:DUF1211 domain-containing protein n=1 Tax=Weissella diestrammenae TaxID=1162633 RepID=A0A7G9T705_9LACO|nr:TMEM175 family protein [Weissella diestrammenae]MCM0582523.1 DUF1211 domain-containing protein [Weissella diestrammenae]QNN75880.1 DUF1211 domain-containing protein [Weissella diestrammenae]